jgi:hypothetical protein
MNPNKVKFVPKNPFAPQSITSSHLFNRGALTAVLTAGLLLVAACGGSSSSTTTTAKTLAVAPVEHAIQQSILGQQGIKTTVSCPANAPLQKGYRITCNAKLDVGAYPVTVTETNAAGGVSYVNKSPLRILNSASVAKAIRLAVRHQRHLGSTVHCPKLILQAKGVKFNCSVRTKHGLGAFSVTEVDEHGHVSFVGR